MKLLILLLSFFSFSSLAGQQVGTVDWLIVRASDGLVYFGIEGAKATGKPTCATNSYWMIKDENSTSGMLQYSMLLSAHDSGRQVAVTGMNTYSRWSDGEDVNTIRLN